MKGRTIANVRVGKPHVKPTAPSHVPGVVGGNERGAMEKQGGIEQVDDGARGTARRSTGIGAHRHGPIDPRMPNLSPP